MPLDPLLDAFNFTEEDLLYNRQGQLSPRQIENLASADRRGKVAIAIASLVSAAIAIGLLLPFIQAMSLEAANLGRAICGVPIFLLAILFFFGIFRKPDRGVKQIEGVVQFVSRDSTTTQDDTVVSTTGFYILVGEKEFPVKTEQYKVFTQGHIYRVYYGVAASMGILSVEYLGPPDMK